MEGGPPAVEEMRARISTRAERLGSILRENLRRLIEDQDLTLSQVANLSGVAPNTVAGFLEGRDSGVGNVLRICLAVGYAGWSELLTDDAATFRKKRAGKP